MRRLAGPPPGSGSEGEDGPFPSGKKLEECASSGKTARPAPSAGCLGGGTNSAPDSTPSDDPLAHFDAMIQNCLAYAKDAHAHGRPIVGILCEFTPRELILAAGAVPVCLCGGSSKTIAAAETELPANLCPLIKSTFGYHVLRSNPFLEMASLVVAETTCDGKKKMYELMAESRPMYVLELPQKPDDPDAFDHWVRELRKLRAALEQHFDVEITDDALRESIRVMNRERCLRRRIAALLQADLPPLTGRQVLNLKSSISGIEEDFIQYEKVLERCEGRPGEGDLGHRVRVLMTGVPVVHGAEKVVDLIEENGGLIVCQENCTGLKPIVEDVDPDADDPMLALAVKYFHLSCSVMTPNTARMDLLRRLVADYRPHCVIDLVWQACLTYDVESARVRRLVEQDLGLPYLRIETDYSPSDTARIATRVEALFEMVRSGYH